jgi:hypothetical protein
METLNNLWKGEQHSYLGTLRFLIKAPYYILSATYSNQKITASTQAIYIDECLDRNYFNGILEGCNKATGNFDFFGKNFELAGYTATTYSNFGESIWVVGDFKQIPLLGTTLNFDSAVLIEGKNLRFYYKGVTRKITFKDKEVVITHTTEFLFSEDGELLSITPKIQQ